MSLPTLPQTYGKGEDFSATFYLGVQVLSSSVANPGLIKTNGPHGFATGDTVWLVGHVGATPSLNATPYVITVVDASSFTIPVNVTVAGAFGLVTNIAETGGDIAAWTMAAYVKANDTDVSPLFVGTCAPVGSSPTLTFKMTFTSAQTATQVVGTNYNFDAWRLDAGHIYRCARGPITVETERKFQTP